MWSGPRNLSTAMMYSFGARTDCVVIDEPFYAAYLARTGLDHPMREEVLAAQPTDPAEVVKRLTGSVPEGKPLFYQKHMTHHMLPGFPRGWLRRCTNVFLIRHPARVVASYAKKREGPVLEDLGFVQQAELFDLVTSWGQQPIVIDSADILAEPKSKLRALCEAIRIPFHSAMLHWPAGGHRGDGVWAAHWYGAVHRSTGFEGAEGELPELTGEYAELSRKAQPYYEKLRVYAL